MGQGLCRTADPPLSSRWGEAYIALDAQLRAVELLAKHAEDWLRAHVERRIAHLEAIRDALHELHHGIADERMQPYYGPGSPLAAYLVASHLWCRETLENLRRHATRPRASVIADQERLADQSSAYVEDCLEPLYSELVTVCEALPTPDHALARIRQRADRAHSAIAQFSWV